MPTDSNGATALIHTLFSSWAGVVIVGSVVLSACSVPEAGKESVGAEGIGTGVLPPPAPTAEELATATYHGILDRPVALVDGQWQGEPFVDGGASRPAVGLAKDFYLAEDLDGDGREETIALLWSSSGGSGTFDYLALMARQDGRVVNLGTAELGDRVDIRSYGLEAGRLVLEVIQPGPDDPRCCPGQKMRRIWDWTEEGLTEVSSESLGRLSLGDLEGVEWVLERFAWNEPKIAEPEIALLMRDGTFVGSSGCNRFQAPVSPGELPGDITVGPIAGTGKTCTEAIDAVEARFLRALESVNRFSFMVGKLVLNWSREDRWDTMVFAPRPLPTSPDS